VTEYKRSAMNFRLIEETQITSMEAFLDPNGTAALHDPQP
jgi:hypothetical protein